MSDTFRKIKQAYTSHRADWPLYKLDFSGHEIGQMISVLVSFSRYIYPAYDNLFVETERGAARISCVSDTAIRVEYFEVESTGDYEWIQAVDFVGNSNATTRKIVEQPASTITPLK